MRRRWWDQEADIQRPEFSRRVAVGCDDVLGVIVRRYWRIHTREVLSKYDA
jgi:hypothetical protein